MTSDCRLTYTWNAENRLVEVDSIAGVSPVIHAEYAYDHQGRRLSKTVNGETTTFLWLGNHIISEISKGASQITNVFVWGQNDHLVSATLSGTNVFYAHDGNKNVTELIDASGNAVAHYEFDPHGNINVKTGVLADVNPFRFSSEYYDLETGHFAFMLRYLDTVTASWMSRDPIEEMGGARLYGFVDNDPINRFDLYGMVFDITFVRFPNLSGHGWIRTGGYETVNVNPTQLLGQSLFITVEGKQALVKCVKMKVPQGIGFYPKVGQSGKTGIRQLLLAMIPVPGRWQEESSVKEQQIGLSSFLGQNITLDEYDTEVLDKRKYFIFSRKFKYGIKKGESCKCATEESVKSCLNAFASKNAFYQVPFAMCRGRAKGALEDCCLEVKDGSSSRAELPVVISYDVVFAGPYR
jgi:RHS repeat-associated protein